MPDPNAPAPAATGPILVDALMGTKVPVYIGGDPLPEIPTGGDRGDNLDGAPAAESLASGSAAAALQTAADEAAAAEAAAAAAEKPPELTDEEKAALPPRSEDGKFKKADEAKPPEGDEPRIPKSRLDKEIERRKAAEAKLADQQAEKDAATKGEEHKFDFDAAEESYMDLLLDGKLKEAAAKRKEIRAAERAENEAMADERVKVGKTTSDIHTALQTIGDTYEAAYAEFNPEAKEFDELAMAQVKAIYGGFLEQGLYSTPDGAFEAALATVVKANGFTKLGATAPPVPPTPAARTATDRVAAIGAQAPSLGKAGESSAARGAHEVVASDLTEDQLSKLPLATLKRLRGDDL